MLQVLRMLAPLMERNSSLEVAHLMQTAHLLAVLETPQQEFAVLLQLPTNLAKLAVVSWTQMPPLQVSILFYISI